MTFKGFKNDCEWIAKNAHCIVEVRNYEQYGWWGASFMTDMFGGCFVNICRKLDGTMYNHIHSKDEAIVANMAELSTLVKNEVEKAYKTRNLEEICEMINKEND